MGYGWYIVFCLIWLYEVTGVKWKRFPKEEEKSINIDAVILILSDSRESSLEFRTLARETYLSPLVQPRPVPDYFLDENGVYVKPPIAYFFVLGIAGLDEKKLEVIQKENKKFNDLIMLNLDDAYSGGGMLLKYFLALQIISSEMKIYAKFYLRSTHDVYIQVPNFLFEVKRSRPDRVFWGNLSKNNGVIRDPSHKNGDMKYNVCGETYHPYMNGHAWATTYDIVRWLNIAFPISKNSKEMIFDFEKVKLDMKIQVKDLPPVPPLLLVNDDTNFGLTLAVLDIEWRDSPSQFLPYFYEGSFPESDAMALLNSVLSSRIYSKRTTHEYYHTYKKQMFKAMRSSPYDKESDFYSDYGSENCISRSDKYICENKRFFTLHNHFSFEIIKGFMYRLLGGCRCKISETDLGINANKKSKHWSW